MRMWTAEAEVSAVVRSAAAVKAAGAAESARPRRQQGVDHCALRVFLFIDQAVSVLKH